MQIARNGVVDTTTSDVSLVLYWNHTVYYQNTAGNWFSWSASGWVATTDPRVAVPGVPLNFQNGTASTSTIPFTWNPPSTGAAIDAGGYKLQYRVKGTTQFTSVTIPVITPGNGSIVGQDNATWTVTAGGQLAVNGVVDTVTKGVTQLLMLLNGQIWQINNLGNWYYKNASSDTTWNGPSTTSPLQTPGNVLVGLAKATSYDVQVLAFNKAGDGTPTPLLSITTANIAPSGVFHVANGQIIDPNGNPFVCRGMAVFDMQIGNITPAQILTKFPKCNSIRLAIEGNPNVQGGGHGYGTASASWSSITSWVKQARSAGLVVILDDHEQSGGTAPYTGATLTQDLNYVQQIGRTFQSDSGVFLQSMNEPGTTNGLAAYHQAFYNALRQTGAMNICLHDVVGGNLPQANAPSDDPSVYHAMVNSGWDVHFYNWMTGGNTNLTQVKTYLNTQIALLKTWTKFAALTGGTANDIGVVWVGECGWLDYVNNPNVDVNGGNGTDTVVTACLTTNYLNGGQSAGGNNWLLDANDVFGWGSQSDMLGGNYQMISQHGIMWNNT